jgi:hypothetical protein
VVDHHRSFLELFENGNRHVEATNQEHRKPYAREKDPCPMRVGYEQKQALSTENTRKRSISTLPHVDLIIVHEWIPNLVSSNIRTKEKRESSSSLEHGSTQASPGG